MAIPHFIDNRSHTSMQLRQVRYPGFLTICNSLLELVRENFVTLRRSDEDRRRASIKSVPDVSVEVFRGANSAPLKMTPYCAVWITSKLCPVRNSV